MEDASTKKRTKRGGLRKQAGGGHLMIVRHEGRQYSKMSSAKTLAGAARERGAWAETVRSGQVGRAKAAKELRDSAPTFAAWSAEYLEKHMKLKSDSDSTKRAATHALGYVGRKIGDTRISDITPRLMHATLREICASGRVNPLPGGDRSLSIPAMRLTHTYTRKCFAKAVEQELIPSNPVPAFRTLELGDDTAPSEYAKRSALTPGQFAAVAAACDRDPQLGLWVRLMAATGARPGEALAPIWGNVDWARRELYIECSVKDLGRDGQGRRGKTKTKSSVRKVPLGARIIALLQAERDRQERVLRTLAGLPENIATAKPLVTDSMCVFWASAKTPAIPPSTSAMRGRFHRAIVAAGLPPKITAHWLRHTFITVALAGDERRPGISIADAAKLAGHSSAQTTAVVYSHAVAANVLRGAELADDLLAPGNQAENVATLPAKKVTGE